MRKMKKYTSLLLSFFMIITTIQWQGISLVKAKTETKKEEKTIIPKENKKNSTTFQVSNNKKETVYFGDDVRFKDEKGKLVDYDPSLVKVEGSVSDAGSSLVQYQYENKDGDKKHYLPKKLTEDTPILMENEDYQISFAPMVESKEETVFSNIDTLERQNVEEEKVLTAENKTEELPVSVSYESKDCTFTYQSLNQGIKENIVLDNIPNSNQINFSLDLGDLVPRKNEMDAGISIYDIKKDEIVASIEAPNMNDATGNAYSEDLSYDISKVNGEKGKYIISLTIDESWLKDENRQYPVTIDPTTTWKSSPSFWDVYIVNGSYKTKNFYDSSINIMEAGQGEKGLYRTYVGYQDFAPTISGKSISEAVLTVYETSYSKTGQTIGAHRVTNSWARAGITWENRPGYISTAYGTAKTTGKLYHALNFDVTAYANWVALGSVTNYGLMLRNANESGSIGRFFGTRYSNSTYRPKMTVTYYDPPTQATSVSLNRSYINTEEEDFQVKWTGINSFNLDYVEYRVSKYDDNSKQDGETIIPYGDDSYLGDSSNSDGYESVDLTANEETLGEGSYHIYVRGVDVNGKAGPGSGQVFHIDKTAPKINSLKVLGNGTQETTEDNPSQDVTPTVSFAIDEKYIDKIQYRINDGEYKNLSSDGKLAIGDVEKNGTYNIDLKVTDLAGNESEASTTYTYIDQSNVVDYEPNTPKVKMDYGKAVVSWKEAKDEELPASIAYEVYRGETEDFTLSDGELVQSAIKKTYCADTKVADGKEYYYKVRAVKLAKTGRVLNGSNCITTNKIKQDDAKEYKKFLGTKDYRDTVEVSTPNGTGTIDKASGNLVYTEDDFDISVGDMGLSLTKTYNSQTQMSGMLGSGWGDSFHKQLYQVGNQIVFKDSDGSYITFIKNGTSYESKETKEYTLECGISSNIELTAASKKIGMKTVVANEDSGSKLVLEGSFTSTFRPSHKGSIETDEGTEVVSNESEKEIEISSTITDKNQTVYMFDGNGYLTGMKDPNGNYVLYEYDDQGRLSQVTSNKNQSLTINYNNGDGEDKNLVKEIKLPDQSKVTYTYHQGDLTKTTHTSADGANVISYSYTYNSNHQMTAMTDGNGNLYHVSYDGEKVTEFKRPEGDATKVSYGDGTTSVSAYGTNGKKLTTDVITFEKETGKLLSSTNSNGVDTTYQYGDTRNPLLQTGTETVVDYQSVTGGSIEFHKDAKVTTSSTYNADENITREVDESGQVTESKYKNESNPNLVTNEVTSIGGKEIESVTSAYDKNGNIIKESDTVSNTQTVYQYENIGNEENPLYELVEETQTEDGATISNETISYDEEGIVPDETTTVKQGDVKEEKVTSYDEMGREIKSVETNPETKVQTVTTTEYDFMGRVTSTTTVVGNQEKQTETKQYNNNGATKSETNVAGITTSYEYDANNRVISTTETADGTSETTNTSYGYENATIHTLDGTKDCENLVVTSTSVNGKKPDKTYTDGNGNVVRTLSGGIYTDHVFTKDGKEIATITLGTSANGNQKIVMSLYNKEGKKTHTIQKPTIATDGKVSIGDDSIVIKTEYDTNGNEIKMTDAVGNEVSYQYDNQNRVTKVEQGDTSTNIAYAVAENGSSTTSITDDNGNINEEILNAAGLTEKTTSKEGVANRKSISTVSTYDEAGNKTKDTYESGACEKYAYDAKNRVIKASSFDGTGQETLRTTYTYDNQDRIIASVDARVASGEVTPYLYTKYAYDKKGQMISYGQIQKESEPSTEEVKKASFTYTYDAEGKLVSVAYPTSKQGITGLTYHYNENGWLTSVAGMLETDGRKKDVTVRTYTYDSYGKVSQMKDYLNVLGTGEKAIQKTYTYDAFNRVKEMVYVDLEHPDTVMESYSYTYDKNSNITKKTQVNNYPSKAEEKVNETKEYTYDSLSRLIQTVTTDHQKNDVKTTNTYTYDGVGNRLTEDINGNKTTYEYNGLDQVKTATTAKGVAVDEVKNYAYDVNGNEISQSSTKTGETIKRTYDTKNQLSTISTEKDGTSALVQTNMYNGDGQRVQKAEGSNKTNYYYQDGVVSYTTDGSNNQTSQNLIGLEGNMIGTQRYTSDTTTYYSYNRDSQGSISSLVKEDGMADATYSYTDFGETSIQGANQAANEVCYTGGIYDKSTGLYYLNARYYNPEDGRFVTEDTYRGETSNPSTQNLYTYCAGNPVNYIDPSGHKYYLEANINELRICTDGKIANKYECDKENPYGDGSHQSGTKAFGMITASDEIPYIVTPLNRHEYIYSVGVIINRNTKDYLYAVVAEFGPNKNGMGEVSIYAAWKMKKRGIPSMNKKVSSKYRIGNVGVSGDWKIIMYKKSAPGKGNKGNLKYGWKYKNRNQLRKQIVKVGKKFYKGGRKGKCLN